MTPPQKPGRSRQDFETPEGFLRPVRDLLGIFAFNRDLAADATNAKAVDFWTVEDDALAQDWSQLWGWNWLNPPFGNITPWVKKAAEANKKIAVLLPAGVGANWYRDYVDGKAFVFNLNGRITFVGESQGYPKDCILAVYGTPYRGAAVWNWRTHCG